MIADKSQPPPRRPTLGETLTFGIPFDRIILDPTPGTATASDVAQVVDHEDRICELVDGTLVERAYGWAESLLVADLIYHLVGFNRDKRRGFLVGPKAPTQLRPGLVRAPDIAFYPKSSLPGGRLPGGSVAALVPDLGVEVWRPGNTPPEMKRKAGDFRAAGTRLIWFVEPRRRLVRVLGPGDGPVLLGPDEVLDGDPVLPGFRLRVGDLLDLGQYGRFETDQPAGKAIPVESVEASNFTSVVAWDSERHRTSGPRQAPP